MRLALRWVGYVWPQPAVTEGLAVTPSSMHGAPTSNATAATATLVASSVRADITPTPQHTYTLVLQQGRHATCTKLKTFTAPQLQVPWKVCTCRGRPLAGLCAIPPHAKNALARTSPHASTACAIQLNSNKHTPCKMVTEMHLPQLLPLLLLQPLGPTCPLPPVDLCAV